MSFPDRASRHFLDARTWLRGLIRATIKPRPRTRIVDWIDANVVIPEESGSTNPGKMRTGRFPVFRGLCDLAQQRGVHYFTFCASARVGKTLFSICLVLYWIAERFGHVVWLDPTRKSAVKFVRSELESFLLQCKPVRAIAVITKKLWTTLEKSFRGKLLRLVASGAEADLHGFQAELAVINEADRCRHAIDRDSASEDKIIARTRQFAATRLILRNSTPGEGGELSPIWQQFLKGSQHYCYVPCPCCTERAAAAGQAREWEGDLPTGWSPLTREGTLAGWQRLSFFVDKKLVPFDADLRPLVDAAGKLLPREQWREETTGAVSFEKFAIMEERRRLDDPTQTEMVRVGWLLDEVETGATYRCAHCQADLEWVELAWMLPRYRWVAHNPFASRDHISAHLSALYSPFEFWGIIAKEFLEAKGNLGALLKVWNLSFGLPLTRSRTAIKEDDLDRCIARCPVRYVQGQIPLEAEVLTGTVDCQGEQFWFTIRAWGVLWDHPELPTWSALVDWGEAVSWRQILELFGLCEDSNGHVRRFTFTRPDGTVREYCVTRALVDSGFEAETNKKVYEFCLQNSDVFSPYKGGDQSKTRGNTIRPTPIMDDQLDLIWAWSDYFAADLYYTCIRDGVTVAGPVHWWLPTNIDRHYREQLTNERQVEENGKVIWKAFGPNHLGDDEKMQRVLEGPVEEDLDDARDEWRELKEKTDASKPRKA